MSTVRTATGSELADLRIFADLSPDVRDLVAAGADVVEVAAGQWLFRQAEVAEALYLVRSGRLEVVQGDVVINELGRGDILGELSLLTGTVRSASVRARRDTQLLRLSREQFVALTDEHPHVLRTVAATVADRLRRIAPPRRETPRPVVVAVLGLGPGTPVDTVQRVLVDELRRTLRVSTPGRVDGVGLERAELAADRVVLSCAGDPPAGGDDTSRWWSFCARQCDRAVLVASSRESPDVPAVGRPGPSTNRVDLLLVGPRPDSEAMRRWRESAGSARIQLVTDAAELPARVRGIARRIAGTSVGLVLGGGGARAFTHIGVIDELVRAGVLIDRVAGTSLGAWVGACFALGMDAERIGDEARREYVQRNPYGDYTIPRVALSRGVRTRTALARCLGPSIIEELPVEFACMSVDLYARLPVTHRRGSLVDAVRASLSLPVLYPPYAIEGRLHVDGGLIDNLPVAALAEPREGPVIAVNVVTDGGEPDTSGAVAPPLIETLMRSIMLASSTASASAQERADLVITPDARGVGLLEFARLPLMVEVGRATARVALGRPGVLDGLLGANRGGAHRGGGP